MLVFILSFHQMQFDEAFALLPTAAGVVVRTGETYVFDTPYHKGNSPTKDVPSSQHNALWTQFISFLRDTVCVRHNKKVRKFLLPLRCRTSHKALIISFFLSLASLSPGFLSLMGQLV